MKRKKVGTGARTTGETAHGTPEMDSLVSLDEMREVQGNMSDLLHRMVDACIALAGQKKPGQN